ncbi:hypothetical protein DM826_02130 [Halonotius aquaticus]|uniref:Endonuclease/exonuclease/phosphatase domain-containing protein n=1 Tax=Halonotius aquaticus TaxID=2216978 RepID=A0A3A6PS11_9EURY|nr:endonuclease/exonuclease/phosphatase family protein [Halonotius aquaticus]RJX44438.1 hypothetical protein DM826_02130 [Halonotius aquaticus]
MDISELSQSTTSRRAVLGSVAGLTAGVGAISRAAATSPASTVTVMTRNAYLGVDLSNLLQAGSNLEFYARIGRFLNDFDPTIYAARAEAIAAEIESQQADIVGLQEAGQLRTKRPGETDDEALAFNFLTRIVSALEDRDLSYRVAADTVTTDIELSGELSDGEVTLDLADRDALLVREGVEVTETVADTFDETITVKIPTNSGDVTLHRGYCTANIRVGGVDLTVSTTHLESTAMEPRRRQAEELLTILPSDRPVILCGDFNSGPRAETETYGLLTETLNDPYAALRPDANGSTCCQAADLQNDDSQLDRRIDGTLYRGDLHPTAIGRVGHRPDDRITIQSDGEMVRLWPSDHAGVVATFDLSGQTDSAATATDSDDNKTPSTSRNRTDSSQNHSESVSESEVPGFSVGGTVAALGGFGYLLKRRLTQ